MLNIKILLTGKASKKKIILFSIPLWSQGQSKCFYWYKRILHSGKQSITPAQYYYTEIEYYVFINNIYLFKEVSLSLEYILIMVLNISMKIYNHYIYSLLT